MPLDLEVADWKAVVEKAVAQTEAGALQWDEEGDKGPNIRQFQAQTGGTTIVLFGRLRNYSYMVSLSKAVEGAEPHTASIEVTNKSAFPDIPFHLLFKAVVQQVREAHFARRKLEEAESLRKIIASVGQEPGLSEDERIDLDPPSSSSDWDALITRLIEATRAGEIKWFSNDPADENSYELKTGGFEYRFEKEPIYGSYNLFVDDEGDFANTTAWEGSSLADLAYVVGISTEKSEEEFAAITKAAVLDDIMDDLGKP